MRLNRIFYLFAVLAGFFVSGQSFAWVPIATCNGQNVKWSGSNASMSASGVGFPVGDWRNALSETVSKWYNQPSNFSISMSWDDASVGLGNGQNEVWWSSNFGAPAVTNFWYNTQTCTFTEADVRFDNTVAYHYTHTASSLWPYGGGSRPFQTTAMHELGHVAGLGHEGDVYNIMGEDWTHIHANCGLAYAYPGEDAVSGVVALYGAWAGALEELGVANWRRTGVLGGGYSDHSRTRVFDAATGVELPLWSSFPEPVYRVNAGQVVRLELTYENMGKTTPLLADARVYLSTNNCITSLDTVLENFWVSQSRDVPFLTTRTITIPTTLASGSLRWLGASIDDPAAHSEFYDNDYENASYIGVRVN